VLPSSHSSPGSRTPSPQVASTAQEGLIRVVEDAAAAGHVPARP